MDACFQVYYLFPRVLALTSSRPSNTSCSLRVHDWEYIQRLQAGDLQRVSHVTRVSLTTFVSQSSCVSRRAACAALPPTSVVSFDPPGHPQDTDICRWVGEGCAVVLEMVVVMMLLLS